MQAAAKCLVLVGLIALTAVHAHETALVGCSAEPDKVGAIGNVLYERYCCDQFTGGQPTCRNFGLLGYDSNLYNGRINTCDPTAPGCSSQPTADSGGAVSNAKWTGDGPELLNGFTTDVPLGGIVCKTGESFACTYYLYKFASPLCGQLASLDLNCYDNKGISHVDFCGPSRTDVCPGVPTPAPSPAPDTDTACTGVVCGSTPNGDDETNYNCATYTSRCVLPEDVDDSKINDAVNAGAAYCEYTPTYKPTTQVCRAAAGACDVAESCSGESIACPKDAVQESDFNCRASTGACDPAEFCDGVTTGCPADELSPKGTKCRPAAGECDAPEVCSGTDAACPVDAKLTSECRHIKENSLCDVAEFCDGATNDCPVDGFRPSTFECNAKNGECDIAEYCKGNSADCPPDIHEPPSTECRAAAGVCDVADFCDGVSPQCPTDTFKDERTVCRDAQGVCDLVDYCTGAGANCPADAKRLSSHVCRSEATGSTCDVAELCDGATNDCPVDGFKSATVVCRGVSTNLYSCDQAENCTGTGAFCPPDTGLSTKGMTYKCGVDIFLSGGLEQQDLGYVNGNLAIAGNLACNVAANRKTSFRQGSTTSSGCAPALCPNNKGLSNMVWSNCMLKDGQWTWECAGKKETSGSVATDLCPL